MTPKPKPENFGSQEDFARALLAWAVPQLNSESQKDFANSAQRRAGLTLSAEDYLRAEGSSASAYTIAAAIALELEKLTLDAATAIAVDVRPSDLTKVPVSLFGRLVAQARLAYEGHADAPASSSAALGGLLAWFSLSGSNPSRGLGRLAAHLGWSVPK